MQKPAIVDRRHEITTGPSTRTEQKQQEQQRQQRPAEYDLNGTFATPF